MTAPDPAAGGAFQLIDRPGFPRALAAMRYRAFRRVWAGALVSNAGSVMYLAALGWLVRGGTDSPFRVAMVSFGGLVPLFVLSPIAGAWADRHPRKPMLLAGLIAQTVVASVLAAAVASGERSYWLLFGFAVAGGVTGALVAPVFQSLMPTLVSPEAMRNGLLLNSMQFNISRAVGPMSAGLVIHAWGEAAAMWVNVASFAAVIGAVAFTAINEPTRLRRDRSVVGDFGAALRYVRSEKAVSTTLLTAAFLAGLVQPIQQALAPVVATDAFDADAARYGVLVGAFGAGALLTAIAVVASDLGLAFRRLATIGVMGISLALAGLALAPSLGMGIAAMALLGASSFIATSTLNSALHLKVDDRVRGRVVAMWMMGFGGAAPIGIVIQGSLAEAFGVRWLLGFDSALAAAVIAVLTLRGRLRLLD